MTYSKPARLVLWSQLSLNGFLLVCLALLPNFLFERNEGGVSNYGVHNQTVVFYTLAFGLSAGLLMAAARSLSATNKSLTAVKRVFYLLGSLFILVLVTTYPYKIDQTLDNFHILAAMMLFVAELVAGGWFALGLAKDRVNLLFFGLYVVGFGLAALTLAGALHVLFISQLLTSLSFGALITRTAAAVTAGREL
jgi:hypothetical protein